MTWHAISKTQSEKILCDGSTRGHRLFLSVSDIHKDTKHLIRNNTNLLILFKQVYNDHVNTDMSYENFCELCRWQQNYGFLVIDKDSSSNERYRKRFNKYALTWLVVVNMSTTQHFLSSVIRITTKNSRIARR